MLQMRAEQRVLRALRRWNQEALKDNYGIARKDQTGIMALHALAPWW